LEQLLPCTGTGTGTFKADIPKFLQLVGAAKPTPPDYKDVALPAPPVLPNMPKVKTAKARPARNVPKHVNVGKIPLPTT
jgi:hypothetical protein